ncbi:DNA gyrase subunit B [Psidium guajava]|nr:DNA gyrase subunit B [Psidium guajava]
MPGCCSTDVVLLLVFDPLGDDHWMVLVRNCRTFAFSLIVESLK